MIYRKVFLQKTVSVIESVYQYYNDVIQPFNLSYLRRKTCPLFLQYYQAIKPLNFNNIRLDVYTVANLQVVCYMKKIKDFSRFAVLIFLLFDKNI